MIEKQIAEAALQQAKVILDNKDFWGGPAAALTSTNAVQGLVGIAGAVGPINPSRAEAVMTGKAAPVAPSASKKTETKEDDGKSESAKS